MIIYCFTEIMHAFESAMKGAMLQKPAHVEYTATIKICQNPEKETGLYWNIFSANNTK